LSAERKLWHQLYLHKTLQSTGRCCKKFTGVTYGRKQNRCFNQENTGWAVLSLAAVDYFATPVSYARKVFKILAPGANPVKLFAAVIYVFL